MYDIIIIGGGVVGCAIARELSRRQLKIAVIEKNADIGGGASKANSGIVHAGFDASSGTLKARLNLRGSRMMADLAKELDFHYVNNGSLVLGFTEEDKFVLTELMERGRQNGVEGLELLESDAIFHHEPRLSNDVRYALYAPSGAIVCPFGLTVAMAENAAANGVEFFRNSEVNKIEKNNDCYLIATKAGTHFSTKIIINAAGIYADQVHALIRSCPYTITPRRGEYMLFDKVASNYTTHTLFQVPTRYGKGVLITPTTHGNLMAGPTAEDINDTEGVNTTAFGLDTVLTKASRSIGTLPTHELISAFAGLRAYTGKGDFIIGEVDGTPGFIDVAGIDSPGLSSAPAIGEYVAALVEDILPTAKREDFIATRRDISSDGGEVICRCEVTTRSEIVEAIRRTDRLFANQGVVGIDSIKRRVRVGSGRCQGGFCTPRIIELIAEEQKVDQTAIPKNNPGSEILIERI
ncbi:MAG: FAD-dependent oxidoreductase [Lachnospiraceae bacterium]|jgi:glycerol-3-phosphate dehydrogenase|nr:FAD-dependent oxidoreductase [Lachnospiraceae bacterium]